MKPIQGRVVLFKIRFVFGACCIIAIEILFHALCHTYFQENWWAAGYLACMGIFLSAAIRYWRVLKEINSLFTFIKQTIKHCKEIETAPDTLKGP